MYYRVAGEGDPVIFLHGFLEDHTMWNDISADIVRMGFQVLLVDLPCHGKSRFSGPICSIDFMANCVDVLCRKTNLENPFVFGHSMGGYVGLELLKLRSIQLTLVHSNFWDDSVEKKLERNRVARIVEKNKMRLINEAIPNLFAEGNRDICQNQIEWLIEKAAEIPSNEIVACTRGMRDRLHNGALLEENHIQMIHGSLDPVVKTEKLKEEVSFLSKAPVLYNIPEAGHMSIWEKPTILKHYLRLAIGKG